MSKKHLTKYSASILYRLEDVEVLACIYGLDGVMNQAKSYSNEIKVAVSRNDKSLCCSAVKLASRFICTAACQLLDHITFDMVQLRFKGNSYAPMLKHVKRLVSYL